MINAIPTKDENGNENGWLLPLWSSALSSYRPEQVYLTVVNPGCSKGPHLHMKRSGRFVCIKGDVRIVTRIESCYFDEYSRPLDKRYGTKASYSCQDTGESSGFRIAEVPLGVPAMIRNIGTEPAYVLNMPDRPWTPEDQDEWPVEGWDYKP